MKKLPRPLLPSTQPFCLDRNHRSSPVVPSNDPRGRPAGARGRPPSTQPTFPR